MSNTRGEILDALLELTNKYPHWRFGQLVSNVAVWVRGATTEAVYEVEDEEFLKALKSHLAKHSST